VVKFLPLMHRQLPNQITILRLVLAGAFFIVLNQYRYHPPSHDPKTAIIWWSIGLFTLAALTDILDGWLARRWKVESRFGRIMDPFCDKVLVIGAFIFLTGPRFVIPEKTPDPLFSLNMVSGVYPWMVAVILSRELFVTGIRGELEGRGVSFGANFWGKMKMLFQSFAVPFVLLFVWLDPLKRPVLGYVRDGLVYATVLVTILSGLPYIIAARKVMRTQPEGQD
jgi:CDP-diacylglycerol--glycerol-3-phosphate 3-phosphatidyltransferase